MGIRIITKIWSYRVVYVCALRRPKNYCVEEWSVGHVV